MANSALTIVVVGGVAGGASAAARARRCNEDARIILFEKDAHVSFANCGLPYYIGGEIAEREKLIIAGPDRFQDRFNIEVHTHTEVIGIDRENKRVVTRSSATGNESTQDYDKLILAPGASPFVPPTPGIDADNVYTLRNLEDTDRIKSAVDASKRIIVVGAGFIGLEMVEQLHHAGKEVALVELLDQVLPPLDPEMAKMVQESLEAHNVDLHLGTAMKEVRVDNGKATGAILENGTELEADAIILGIGVRPNTQLAEAAGLDIGPMGGIVVDEYLRTSDSDIYAAGDAVEYPNTFLGRAARVPLAGPANRAGRIAGEHAATGHARPMGLVQGTAILRVFDKTAASTGIGMKTAAREKMEARAIYVAGGHHAGYFPGAETLVLKLIYEPDEGAILGAQAVGGAGVDKRIDIIATLMNFGGTVYDLAKVDLTYAPPFGSAKDPVHMAAFVAMNDLDGLDEAIAADAEYEGYQIVDVRTPEECGEFGMDGAINIPIDELRNRIGELDPSKPTIVTCHSGQRAHVGACMLKGHGFGDVKNLTGGALIQRRMK